VLIPSNPKEILPLQSRTVQSSNWSGYAVTSKSHKIGGVSSSYVVPKVRAGSLGAFAATWTGIGGYKTHDLIQAGTGEDAKSDGLFGKQYFAWYELLPNSEHPISGCRGDSKCKVSPGNRITVTIRDVGTASWTISMTNSGHWHWSKHVHYASSRSSAEWILEAPTIGGAQTALAPVGTVHFGPTSKYTVGTGHPIAGGHPIKIVLTGEAKPSSLAANGQSFNDCAYRSGTCPRP
jgi:Peptidase A4 family